MAKKSKTASKKAPTLQVVEQVLQRATTVEVALPENLKWKVVARNQAVETAAAQVKTAQAAVSTAEAQVEIARLQEQRARDQLQLAVDELKGAVEVPEGYEMMSLALDRGVGVCSLSIKR